MDGQKEVCSIIEALGNITGLGVCFYDLTRFFSYHYGNLEKQYTGHYCEFCKAVRELPGGREACVRNDTVMVKRLAQSYKRPFLNLCHIGLCECIVPVMKEDVLIGILFIGQCSVESETNFAGISEKIKNLQGNCRYFEKLFEILPTVSRKNLLSAGKLGELSFRSLVEKQSLDIQNTSDVIHMAKQYIYTNYMNHISLSNISKQFHVNPSYLSRKFKEKNGVTVSDYIATTRIEHAKKLLACSDIPIAHISFNVGFADQNYFARVFKGQTAQTPQNFRKLYRTST